jgi:hypothetical protein
MLLYQQTDFRIDRNIAVHVLQHPDKVDEEAPGKDKHHQKDADSKLVFSGQGHCVNPIRCFLTPIIHVGYGRREVIKRE